MVTHPLAGVPGLRYLPNWVKIRPGTSDLCRHSEGVYADYSDWTPPKGAVNNPIWSLSHIETVAGILNLGFQLSDYYSYLHCKHDPWPPLPWIGLRRRVTKVGVSVALVKDGEVLLDKRADHLHEYPGRYHVIPAGTFAPPAETLGQCAVMELEEELGIQETVSWRLCFTGLFFDHTEKKVETTWAASIENMDFEPSTESESVFWAPLHRLPGKSEDWIPAGLAAVKLAEQAWDEGWLGPNLRVGGL